ncbi:cell cycle control protein 50B [Tachysurus fulvidraco]|uniref:cell cycle control protein 50B n=1 Tax=Tachysurus fulvidraco TaxID=1234273 RepID=UPI000F4E71B8|nr:cell cycle control protein 50B [Tachysurus fulvidraco]XP_027015920.1 cell cycle control protein 50B [Tachysurus fulvidraco]XP_027015921.1 cell cycle control protein 50B [Tachysurus fulvidraco]
MATKGSMANRPDNTAFTQQRLPAWQPILSAGIVIPGFTLIGLAFIGIGVALFVTSQNIKVLERDYTGISSDSSCSKCIDPAKIGCTCAVNFSFSELFEGPVFFYYAMTNYYQNYRTYGVSVDPNQLVGETTYIQSPDSTCSPYQNTSNGTPIVPCGSIANSMFNDSFTLYQVVNGQNVLVPFDRKGIAWWTDYNIKYRNPAFVNGSFANAFAGTTKPINWQKPVYELDPNDQANNGFLNQDFLVWMRRAALPNFRKLYGRITGGAYANGLPAGNYTLEINYNYPVKSFEGTKSVVFTNVSWMGGKNQFLGIAYLVIGSLCIVMAIVMLIVYAKYKFSDDDSA